MRKQWTLIRTNKKEVQHLQEVLNIHPVFCQLLIQRGIKTFEEAKRFFHPELAHLHDPFLMKDMTVAVERIEAAIRNKERILLYGDYDVDGTTSVALMYDFLSNYHKTLDYYIPDRYKEGYGISLEGIDYAKQNGVTLIIAMDCGITAIQQVAKAKSLGIDFIICDHHKPKKSLPEAIAVLDPKRNDCNYPYKELSGCGITFKLAQAIAHKNGFPWIELIDLLEFVAISIACDIVPITGENRVLTYFGLKKLNTTKRYGMQALIDQSNRKFPLSISDVVFGLGPLINAAGRLADAHIAVRLMLSHNKYVAYDDARTLKRRNQLRKEYDLLITEEAKVLINQDQDFDQKKSIVFYQPHWHKGVIGIAASRLVEKYNKPTIIMTESNGKAVGSARSVKGFNIYNAIQACEDLLDNYGGHDFAAGLNLPLENVNDFQRKFESIVQQTISEDCLFPELRISSVLNLEQITPEFWSILQQFAPFGPGNRNPVFVSKDVCDIGYSKILTGNHLKLVLKQNESKPIYGIAFGMGNHVESVKSKNPFHICYKLEANNWKGEQRIQLVAKDMKFENIKILSVS